MVYLTTHIREARGELHYVTHILRVEYEQNQTRQHQQEIKTHP